MKKTQKNALSLAAILFASSVNSASITTTFNVTANVLSTCSTVTANSLAFGDYDPLSGADKDSTNTINVTCSNGTPFSIKLNGGVSGTIAQRKMQQDSGTDELTYSLYTDASRSTIWGDGATGQAVNGVGTGSAIQETVYGRVNGGQTDKGVGTYSDTITVTVDY